MEQCKLTVETMNMFELFESLHELEQGNTIKIQKTEIDGPKFIVFYTRSIYKEGQKA